MTSNIRLRALGINEKRKQLTTHHQSLEAHESKDIEVVCEALADFLFLSRALTCYLMNGISLESRPSVLPAPGGDAISAGAGLNLLIDSTLARAQ